MTSSTNAAAPDDTGGAGPDPAIPGPARPDSAVSVGAVGAASTTRAPGERADGATTLRLRPTGRLQPLWLATGLGCVVLAMAVGLAWGPVDLGPLAVARALADALPGVDIDSGLSPQQLTILWQLRLPRVVLGGLVGAMLAVAGAGYQGTFRNPLADPFLLGVAAGAGVGATMAIAAGLGGGPALIDPLPLSAFAGALVAVGATYALSRTAGGERSTASLVLSGVAVAAFFTAVQTFVQMRNTDAIRQIYAWMLGRLTTAGWSEVLLVLPYVVASCAVLVAHRRLLDVVGVGDREATALGVPVRRVRVIVVLAASLGTAAAVAVSGLIGFVGIIVPHTVRLLAGGSYRTVVPLSLLFGAAFLIVADLLARLVLNPAELPIGVVTAFVGAPFFVLVLHRRGPR